MKITLEQWNEKYSIESKGSEQTLDEMLYLFTRMLKTAGYVFDGELQIVNE